MFCIEHTWNPYFKQLNFWLKEIKEANEQLEKNVHSSVHGIELWICTGRYSLLIYPTLIQSETRKYTITYPTTNVNSKYLQTNVWLTKNNFWGAKIVKFQATNTFKDISLLIAILWTEKDKNYQNMSIIIL